MIGRPVAEVQMKVVRNVKVAFHCVLVITRLHVVLMTVLMNVIVFRQLLGHLGLFALRTVQTVRALLLLDLLVYKCVQHALVVSIDRIAVGVTERALVLAIQRTARIAQRVTLQFGVL